MHLGPSQAAWPAPERAYRVRVLGPEDDSLSVADLQRLFPGETLTAARRERLRDGSRIVIACGDRIVAVGVYQFTNGELRISDIGLDVCAGCDVDDVVGLLVESCAFACLAAGCCRIVLIRPASASAARLRKRGYEIANDGVRRRLDRKALLIR